MASLLPCPFCGSDEVNNTSYADGHNVDGKVIFVIVCPDCICSICQTLSLSEAVAAWNMRPNTMEVSNSHPTTTQVHGRQG